jgi:hypothetical protein
LVAEVSPYAIDGGRAREASALAEAAASGFAVDDLKDQSEISMLWVEPVRL